MNDRTVCVPTGPRFGVIGSPVQHSLSPVLHRTAYEVLGLDGPTYDRFEVFAGQLAGFLADGPGRELSGVSVTMPGKPGEMTGTAVLEATADGGTIETVELTVKVRVPLVAGKLESLISSKLKDGWDTEHGVGTAWLKGDR